jgi:hypothetical protein
MGALDEILADNVGKDRRGSAKVARCHVDEGILEKCESCG